MKRLLLLLAFLPSAAFAQVNTSSPTGFQWSSGSGGSSGSIIAGVTLASGCTANWLLYTDSTGHVNCAANMTFDGVTITFNTATTFLTTPSGNSIASNWHRVSGTQPTVLGANFAGSAVSVTSAGSSAFSPIASYSELLAGYTGATSTIAGYFNNSALGTGAWFNGNVGVVGSAFGNGAVTNVGGIGLGQSATANAVTIGLLGQANGAAGSGASFGVVGQSRLATTARAGGFFYLSGQVNTQPSLGTISAALIADNQTQTADIFDALDNDVAIYKILDNGGSWGALAKTLTESSATAFAQFAVASGSSAGGNIDYCIEANDSTDFQSRCGTLAFAAVNKAGAITCTVGTPDAASEVVAVSTGTLSNTFTCTDATSGNLQIKANAVSSLTQTTLRINYFPRQSGNSAIGFSPQ